MNTEIAASTAGNARLQRIGVAAGLRLASSGTAALAYGWVAPSLAGPLSVQLHGVVADKMPDTPDSDVVGTAWTLTQGRRYAPDAWELARTICTTVWRPPSTTPARAGGVDSRPARAVPAVRGGLRGTALSSSGRNRARCHCCRHDPDTPDASGRRVAARRWCRRT